MEIGKHLVLSTAHIRYKSAELLDNWTNAPAAEQPVPVASTPWGWFVPTKPAHGRDLAELPDELAAILAFGRSLGCDYVLLDSDGPLVEQLPEFPW